MIGEAGLMPSAKKEKKAKGAVVDEGYEVTLIKHFSDFWYDGAF